MSYKICNRCIMDTSDVTIEFNNDGTCNHCTKYFTNYKTQVHSTDPTKLQDLVEDMKNEGKNKEYDCIIGVSGGVDSTYIAYLTKTLGLRPLAVHLDNGWNSELAVKNIELALQSLNIPLYTYIIDWEEFKDLQKSFLKASIPGMEIPTDHAILAILYKVAAKNNVRYILNGSNFRTEQIMSPAWSEAKGQRDWHLIKSIHSIFGKIQLKTFPKFSLASYIYYRLFKKQRIVTILNYVDFSREKAMEILDKELGWKYYGGKHYESIYTRFTQGYIQPIKFGFDKRRAHLSNLICSKFMTRGDALGEMEKNPYQDQNMLKEDIRYFKTKLSMDDNEFDEMMNTPIHSYKDYPCYENSPFYSWLMKTAFRVHFWLKARGFYA